MPWWICGEGNPYLKKPYYIHVDPDDINKLNKGKWVLGMVQEERPPLNYRADAVYVNKKFLATNCRPYNMGGK